MSTECIPRVEAADLVSYLVLESSFYTKDQFKKFESLHAYNQMVSGFITSILGQIFSDKHMVVGKVRHSQQMNDLPVQLRIITTTTKPSAKELDAFYKSLSECKIKPVWLSLEKPYANTFISKTRNISTYADLFYLKLIF